MIFQRLWHENNDTKLKEDGAYGPMTNRFLSDSPAEGFANGGKIDDFVAQKPSRSRLLRISRPLLAGEDGR
ncbi:MAG: hypothetical protein F6K19_10105 [Cyanothece sp. SIO1E1]|nr:hypothetical protein [Cyanothece sp. SIO1E1]